MKYFIDAFPLPLLLVLSAICFYMAGCNSLPKVDNINFCYTDKNDKEYCGGIGFASVDSNKEKNPVLLKTDKDGKKEKLYTFTEEEIKKLAKKIKDEGISALNLESDYGKLKEYCEKN